MVDKVSVTVYTSPTTKSTFHGISVHQVLFLCFLCGLLGGLTSSNLEWTVVVHFRAFAAWVPSLFESCMNLRLLSFISSSLLLVPSALASLLWLGVMQWDALHYEAGSIVTKKLDLGIKHRASTMTGLSKQ